MLTKIICYTQAGWFFWDGVLYASEDRAQFVIDNQPEDVRDSLGLAHQTTRGVWHDCKEYHQGV